MSVPSIGAACTSSSAAADRLLGVLIYLPLFVTLALPQPAPPAPMARALAPDTFLLPGTMLPERGPDGNTIIFVAPSGLIVVDTGRHAWHSDGILAFAAARQLPISVIVNTHWHLDHSSGNGRLRAAHPRALLHTTRAVDRALAPGGFLTRNLTAARAKPPDPKMSATRREETELFFKTMEASERLRPDVVVERAGTRALAGRSLSLRVAAHAVTDADLWLIDEATGVAVIGDLVTLPAPFFETACPSEWQAALDQVWAAPFRVAVPGHGDPMTRDEFDTYRRAFIAFRSCVGSSEAPATCAAGWTKGVESLLDTEGARREATEFATYYVGFLRKNGGASPDCQIK
jgi:glyoxylase-like metal-dependent hydrolase (beta-lactamase superfamily II)